MALTPGTKLARYEIRSQLGAGGMGEVYRARDTEIGREVAVKVLPSAFAEDPDRLQRFQQEACAAGALNHPNILSIYDVGKHNGAPYLVSELLEGETLRKRIAGLSLGQRRALDYALQISNGLAAAHEKGIVHRDLKPDNIFITNDGRVKILDFGLAKLTQRDTEQAQTDIPTRRVDTAPGVIMGTVGYMSPEQLKGHTVDQRSDVFSFGAILYEMLSGRRAFHGQSAAETMSAILKEDPPDLSDTNKSVSPALARLVTHCLEKNPEARFHSARDLAFTLEAFSGTNNGSDGSATLIAPVRKQTKRRERLLWLAIAAVLTIALVAALPFAIKYFRRSAPAQGQAVRFLIFPPEKATLITNSQQISPDGTRLVYVASGADGKRAIWTRRLDSLNAELLTGTEEPASPFWSPDGRSLGFFSAGSKLEKIELNGGPAQVLTGVQGNAGGTWNNEGVILFARSLHDGLYRIPASGGSPTPVTTLDESRKETGHLWPHFLPDGRHFLFLARSTQRENTNIYAGSLDSPERKLLLNVDSNAVYAPPGFLLFRRQEALMGQQFDAEKLELQGEPFPIADRIDYGAATGHGFFSASQTGALTFISTNGLTTQLVWFDRGGKQLAQIDGPAADVGLRLSPDEKHLAVSRLDSQGSSDIWVIDLLSNKPSRLTFDPAGEVGPVWSPDSSRIVFFSDRGDGSTIYQRLANGTGKDEVVAKFSAPAGPHDWSPDGRFILFSIISGLGSTDLWVIPLFGEQKPAPLVQTEFSERQGRFSPDGKWIAYTSNASGTYQVYVEGFPTSGGKWQVSTAGGAQPQWRGDGKELFYLTPDRKLMAVEVNGAGSAFTAGIPKVLFELNVSLVFPGGGGAICYAPTRDGQRFIVNTIAGDSSQIPITVVLNWTADLKR
jgi:serine/threonine protein kinase/Tol biopolymer transport system component